MSSAEKNDLLRCAFLQRLKSLQGLCCSNNAELPDALLFIPGQDGRHNKGSTTILKYLFQGSVGKELFEGVLDSTLECLEETTLLIQESSVSIFYGTEAKKIIGPLLSSCPLLIEYITTEAEEEEVDLFQARKCVDFKRMLLESVPEGGVIGMSVPIGYDEVQDTETWPLLQSFALDDVYCSTGFFSARYAIVDITDHLNIIFNSIDSFYIEKALTVIHQSILPHALQTLSILEVSNAEQRERMTIETILSPFDLLFEFGDMESTTPVDPALQPVLLPGVMSAYLGSPIGSLPSHWKQQVLGHSLHAVCEGFEPSTGMRWCRTYFLHTTTSTTNTSRLSPSTPLNDRADVVDVDDDELIESQATATAKATTADAILYHLQYVYIKLWLGLRHAVTVAFQKNHDVLEAGKDVQDIMESLLHPNASIEHPLFHSPNSSQPSSILPLPPIYQIMTATTNHHQNQEMFQRATVGRGSGSGGRENEVLQVHMDCLDGSGKVVSIEDVDDMDGQCWVYIRVSIHGILCGLDQQDLGSIAVGDTFLFTSKLKPLQSMITSAATGSSSIDRNNNDSTSFSESTLSGLVADKYCLTHSLPYFRQYVGSGHAEWAAHELNSQIRNNHMLATLGMGALFDSEENNEVVLPVILDHICYPLIDADLRLFTTGFVIQRIDHITCLPVAISIAEHVERVWTIDTDSCWNEINKLVTYHPTHPTNNKTNATTTMSTQYLPEGFFIIFQLKKELLPEQLALLLSNQNDEKKQEENIKKKKKRLIQDSIEKIDNGDKLVTREERKGDDEKEEVEQEDEDEDEENDVDQLMGNSDSKNVTKVYENPLKANLPAIYRKDAPRHIALLIREDSREFPMMSRILTSWRKAFREYEIDEHRGASSDAPLPQEVIDSLLCAVNQWSVIAERKELAEEGVNLPLVPAKELLLTGLNFYGQISQLGSGFTNLRCSFALSQSLQNTSYTEQLLQSILSKHPPNNNLSKVVMLFGVPGSGVVSVAHAIYSRLTTTLSDRSTPSSLQEGFLVLDLSVYDRSELKDSLDFSRLITPMLVSAKGKILVIAVILSVTTYIPSIHILQHISQLDHAAVVWAGAVLSAATTTAGRESDDLQGTRSTSDFIVNTVLQPERDGYKELRRSIALESLVTGICDTVFIIDNKSNSSGSSTSTTSRRYETTKADVEMHNSSLDICKVNAGTLHIDESILESISNAIITTPPSPSYTTTSITTSQRSCVSLLRCGGSSSSNTLSKESDTKRQSNFHLSSKGLGVRCVPISLHDNDATTTAQWDFTLLAYCLQKLFPTATSHSLLTFQEKYYNNNNHPKLSKHLESIDGFQKIIFSSKVKIMRQRQQEEGKKQLEQLFRNFDEKEIVRIQSAIISVHGLFTISKSSEDMLTVEGCGDSIFIKPISSAHTTFSKSPSTQFNNKNLNQLLIYGAFQNQEIQLLTTLFQHCCQIKLTYRKKLVENDLSFELKTKLQEDTTLEIPLPSGWWFDGNAYIDIHGTRRNIRPDIGEVVKVYLAKRNAQVNAYNTVLEEVIEFL